MPATPLDSAIYRDLLHDAEAARLFSDSAEVRAMLLVEGALARAQGAQGLIPELSARAIHRASLEVAIDPAGLARGAGQSGVVVPALVAAFRDAVETPEHAQFIHWGATSQDIIDTGLILRLRQLLALVETRLTGTVKALGRLAEAHAALPMAGRTWGQAATPTSFGAVAAAWGAPLVRLIEELPALRGRALVVSLSGATGTLSAMGAAGPEVRARMAAALDLGDPGESWHSGRDRITALAAWMTRVAAQLGKIGEDMSLMCQTEAGELRLAASGGSSTMPQKQNPVAPALLTALARHSAALDTALQGAGVHRQQRDGAAWFTEWLALPQLCLSLARATAVAADLADSVAPEPEAMAANLEGRLGLIHAEALSFALAPALGRPKAQAAVKTLCGQALETGTPLPALARAAHPELDLAAAFDAAANLGTAPADARRFAAAAAALPAP